MPAAAPVEPAFPKPTTPVSGRPNMPIAPLPSTAPAPAFPAKLRKPVPPAREPAAHAGRNGLKLLLALLFVATGLFAVLAYNYWFAEPDAPAPVVRKTETAPAEAPAAPEQKDPAPAVPDAQASDAGKALAQVKATVAAHDAAHTAPVDDLLAPEAPAVAASTDVSKTSIPAPVSAPATSAVEEPAPVVADVPATSVPAPAPAETVRPDPTPAFRSFVASMKIAGVFQGDNARAMINGKMYRLGETVDPKLGIVFRRLEPADKRIVFEDNRGALMSRRY